MGNRFASLDEYHVLIQGHGILAAITFLFVLPASIMIVRFRDRNPEWGQRIHVYLNILAIFLVTIVFILGWFAVGPSRSLTNPHHGIGLTIYVLMLVQLIGGAWVRRRLRSTQPRRAPVKLMLHQWLGRAIALLGIAQVPLGLTLYGSPQFTFVLYTLWMTFLLVLYFVLSYRRAPDRDFMRFSTVQEESVIEERKSGGIGKYILPAAAAAGLAGLLSRGRSKRESRESRQEVISSRRGSRPGSYIEEVEKYSEDSRERRGGIVDKLLTGAAVLGAGAFAKSWWDRRQARKRDEEAYSAVATDTPSRHRRRNDDHSVISEESVDVRRDRRHGSILPGPGDPLAAAAAISATQSRPVTPRPGPPPVMPPVERPRDHRRHDSFSSYDSRDSPRRERREDDHTLRNTALGAIGLGWLAKKYRDRKDRQEQQRVEALRAREIEDERRLDAERRSGTVPPRFTGDGTPRRSHGRVAEVSDSDISSDLTASTVEPRRNGPMPPLAAGAIPAAAAAGAAAGAAGAAGAGSRSRHDVTEPVPPPPREPREWQESGSEVYNSAGGREHRRHHPSRGREAEAAAAGAVLGVAAAEEERRRRERSRGQQGVASPPVSLKVKVNPDRGVTLRRLTEEEAAAERAARRDQSRRRGDSVSSHSAADTAASNRRYRRDESARRDAAEAAAGTRVEAGGSSRPLSPPRPAFAAGRTQKDSSYFSGAPPPPESLGSHGTRSGVSPSGAGTAAGEDAEQRRRRRRAERNQRQVTGTVEYE
jgi:hypothetical protein